MTFGKFIGGVLLIGAVGYAGYFLEVPNMMIGVLCGVMGIVYFAAAL
jgi:hypothetical protein